MSAEEIVSRINFSEDRVGVQLIKLAVNALCESARIQRQVRCAYAILMFPFGFNAAWN